MSGNINNIPVAYQQLMYQHFIAIQQFFLYPLILFFCHLQHTNMLSGKGSACKFLPHTLRYFISMDSYFDEQLHQVELPLYAQNNRMFLPMVQKFIVGSN